MGAAGEELVASGDACLMNGDLDGAEAAYRRAVDAEGRSFEVLYSLGASADPPP